MQLALAASRFYPFTRALLNFAMRIASIPIQKSSRRVLVEGKYRRLNMALLRGA